MARSMRWSPSLTTLSELVEPFNHVVYDKNPKVPSMCMYLASMGTPGCGGSSPSLSMMSKMGTLSAPSNLYTALRPGMVILDVV